MANWRLRLRAVLDNQYAVVVGALLVVVVLGGWLTYTAYATPSTTTETESTMSWEQTGRFDHAATVQTNSSVFSVGTTLENRSVYFTRLAPELNGTFRTAYDPRDSGELNQTVTLSLVIREVREDDQDASPTVYWQTTDSLAAETIDGVAPGEQISVSFSQNMTVINTRIDQIREDIGSSPGSLEVAVHATVSSQGTINGETVNKTTNYTMPVTVSESTYRVSGAEPTVESYETTQVVTVDRSVGPLRRLGGPLLVIVSLALLGGVVLGSNRLALSETERAMLADESDRQSFDDWISTIKLPPEAFELPRAETDSLAALVDVAIDTDNPVIEDPDESVYYVRHDGYLYSYRPAAECDNPADAGTDDDQSDGSAVDGENSDSNSSGVDDNQITDFAVEDADGDSDGSDVDSGGDESDGSAVDSEDDESDNLALDGNQIDGSVVDDGDGNNDGPAVDGSEAAAADESKQVDILNSSRWSLQIFQTIVLGITGLLSLFFIYRLMDKMS